ncbi:MAG: Integrase [Frankiales bacterium]|nr:Integrase [Frankiales bacterium]
MIAKRGTRQVRKRCGCIGADGRELGDRCPDLSKSGHGTWLYRVDLGPGPDANGIYQKRRPMYKSGFRTKREAQEALDRVRASKADGATFGLSRLTVAQYLEAWLAEKVESGALAPATARSYRAHLDLYFVPMLGDRLLIELRAEHIAAMYAAIRAGNAARKKAKKQEVGPATIRRIHATLSSALNSAVKRRTIPYNPAVHVDLPKVSRPKVSPWQPAELGRFLDFAATDRLGAMFEVMAFAGLRRGEAVGLRWQDVDLSTGIITVRQQIVDVGGQLMVTKPKTASGEDRRVDIDGHTIGTLLEHQLRQDAERAIAGTAWADTGLVFTREDGTAYRPEHVTRHMQELAEQAGLSRKRLHDLRHGSASLQLAAGVPIAVVSKRMGHSSIAITNDTYSHLLEGVGRQAAEAAAAIVPRALRGASPAAEDAISKGLVYEVRTSGPENYSGLSLRGEKDQVRWGGPPGDRTLNPRIKSPLLCQLS